MLDPAISFIGGIILFLFITTLIIRRFTNAETFYLFSMLKSTRYLPLLDKFSHYKKFLNIFSEIGLILGMGLPAFDYLYARKKKLSERLAMNLFAFVVLIILYNSFLKWLVDFNPLTKDFSLIFTISFGLFGLAGYTLLSLIVNAFDIISKLFIGVDACPGVAPLIPGVQFPGLPLVPLHAWLSLLIILIVHEGMHGVLARKEGFKIKSAGLLLAGILPIGAFVEPDEKELEKANPRKALRVFAAGPSGNLLSIPIFFIILSIILILFSPISASLSSVHNNSVQFVKIDSVEENFEFCGDKFDSPAFGKIEANSKLLSINDENVLTVVHASNAIRAAGEKEMQIAFENSSGETKSVSLQRNEIGRYGFTISEQIKQNFVYPPYYFELIQLQFFILEFFGWLMLLSLLIAIFNFLPLGPLDGGRIAQVIFLPYFGFLKMNKKDTEKLIGRIFLWFILVILLLNALPLIV